MTDAEIIADLRAQLATAQAQSLTPEEAQFTLNSDLSRAWSTDLHPGMEELRITVRAKLRQIYRGPPDKKEQ